MKKYYLALFTLSLSVISCGSNDFSSDGRRPTADGEVGAIKALVTNSKSFNPNISHGQIVQYKVTITGDGIVEPIVATFEGTAESGIIEGVPAGKDRTIKVEAINPNNVPNREGESSGIIIKGGEISEAEVKMESVPVFTNLAGGNSIPNTRFAAKVFSDPSDKIVIEDEFRGTQSLLFDVSLNSTELLPDVATGLAKISPPLLPAGEHKFIVKNTRTGRFSGVSVKLTDGSKLKAAPVYGAASNLPVHFGQAVMME